MRVPRAWFAALALTLSAAPAHAAFHFMQVEQVIGGVQGDVSAQAIQLRTRSAGQNLVSATRIRVFDAAGANPILLEDLTSNVPNGQAGRRILLATPAFAGYTNIPLVADFVMDPIPASYLAAGSLTFEDDAGTIYWRLSWGGASYSGAGTLSTTNDADGNANPPFAGPLSSTTVQALQFTGAASVASTSNSLQYAVTAGAATFINNGNVSFVVVAPPSPPVPLLPDGWQYGLGLALAAVLARRIRLRERT
jgi:hypothetical protein